MQDDPVVDKALSAAEKLAAGQPCKAWNSENSRTCPDSERHEERIRAAIRRIRSDPRWKPGKAGADQDPK